MVEKIRVTNIVVSPYELRVDNQCLGRIKPISINVEMDKNMPEHNILDDFKKQKNSYYTKAEINLQTEATTNQLVWCNYELDFQDAYGNSIFPSTPRFTSTFTIYTNNSTACSICNIGDKRDISLIKKAVIRVTGVRVYKSNTLNMYLE